MEVSDLLTESEIRWLQTMPSWTDVSGREILSKIEKLAEAFTKIERYADVMIGDGPGAVMAYYRDFDRVAEGLPTTFAQMKDHATEIRKVIHETERK